MNDKKYEYVDPDRPELNSEFDRKNIYDGKRYKKPHQRKREMERRLKQKAKGLLPE